MVCLSVAAGQAIPAGKHQVRMEFAYDGGGLAKGGNVTLYYDGQKVGEGRESGTPVSADYDRHSSVFTGKINWVQIDLWLDDQDHLISPQERFRVAMARQ